MDALCCYYFLATALFTISMVLHHTAADSVQFKEVRSGKERVSRNDIYEHYKHNDYDDVTGYDHVEFQQVHPSHTQCYHCYKSTHGDNCRSLDLKNHRDMRDITAFCDFTHDYCMVEKMITNGALTTFRRSCSSTCKENEGCRKAGENYVVERCRSCCRGHLCNTGNSASHLNYSPAHLIMFSLIPCLFRLHLHVSRSV